MGETGRKKKVEPKRERVRMMRENEIKIAEGLGITVK